MFYSLMNLSEINRIYQISCTQSLYIQTNTFYAQFIYHNLNEIKWILAKVFGTFRDIVISSLIKPRLFWVFWWLLFFISTSRPDDWFLYLINLTKEKNYNQTLQATLIIKWLNIHTIHLKIESSFLSSESNGSYWNKNEQKKKYAHNARTLRINLHKISGTQNNMHTDETKIIMNHSWKILYVNWRVNL